MHCDSDVSRVLFRRLHEAVEMDIRKALTPILRIIKVEVGECPVINTDMSIYVEVGDEPCQYEVSTKKLIPTDATNRRSMYSTPQDDTTKPPDHKTNLQAISTTHDTQDLTTSSQMRSTQDYTRSPETRFTHDTQESTHDTQDITTISQRRCTQDYMRSPETKFTHDTQEPSSTPSCTNCDDEIGWMNLKQNLQVILMAAIVCSLFATIVTICYGCKGSTKGRRCMLAYMENCCPTCVRSKCVKRPQHNVIPLEVDIRGFGIEDDVEYNI